MERRLTTILAADIAGFSRLIGLDEEGTLTAQRGHRPDLIDPLLVEQGGRIANTAGDSLLIEFPSAVEAVRCAVAAQEGMRLRNAEIPEDRRIAYRIGVNVGDVVDQDGDLLGDGVNVAARLEALAPPGGVILSRAARDQVRDKLDLPMVDLGEIEVKNIARPVRAFQVLRDGETPVRVPATVRRHRPLRIAMLCLAAAVVAGLVWFRGLGGLIAVDDLPAAIDVRPAMIVLPLQNLSGDPSQDYFSDGFTEDITTELARIRGFMVIARNTAFTYKGKAIDAREIGRQLGVRYILEGSARQQQGNLRINAQLIETASGTHLWAERYDRPMQDLFIVQDALVNRIVGSVAAHLRRHEGERVMAASPETLAAYDLTSRARILFRRNTVDSMTEARTLLQRATAIDPGYAPAFSVLAQVENFFFTSRVSEEYARDETAVRVVAAAGQAVQLAPQDGFAHAVYGMSLRMQRDYDGAARAAHTARDLAPNDPEVLATVSVILLSVGDYRASVDTMHTAWALDPFLSPVFIGVILSQGLFALGDYQGSKEVALSCLQRTPQDVRCHESLVRALGELKQLDEAERAIAELLRLSPDYNVSEYIKRASKNRADREAIKRWADGLRKAGLPD